MVKCKDCVFGGLIRLGSILGHETNQCMRMGDEECPNYNEKTGRIEVEVKEMFGEDKINKLITYMYDEFPYCDIRLSSDDSITYGPICLVAKLDISTYICGAQFKWSRILNMNDFEGMDDVMDFIDRLMEEYKRDLQKQAKLQLTERGLYND